MCLDTLALCSRGGLLHCSSAGGSDHDGRGEPEAHEEKRAGGSGKLPVAGVRAGSAGQRRVTAAQALSLFGDSRRRGKPTRTGECHDPRSCGGATLRGIRRVARARDSTGSKSSCVCVVPDGGPNFLDHEEAKDSRGRNSNQRRRSRSQDAMRK